MLSRGRVPLFLTVFGILAWILPPAVLADRIGSPYRGPVELLGAGGGQDQGGESPVDTGGDTGGGGGDGGGESGSTGPGAPTGGGNTGGAGGKEAKLDGQIVWQWWWEYSKEPYLARAAERGRVNMGSAYYWFGGGAKYPPRDIVTVGESQRAGAIFQQLKKSLHQDSSPGVRAEAAIALGRGGVVAADDTQKKEGLSNNLVVRELIDALEKDPSHDVHPSIILALGMTRDKDASSFLLRNFSKLGTDEKPWAVVALGLSGDLDAIGLLLDLVPRKSRDRDDIGIAAIHAIGLLGPAAVPELEKAGAIARLEKLADSRGYDALQAQLMRTLSLLQVGRREVTRMASAKTSQNIQWMTLLSLANYTADEKDAEEAFKQLQGKNGFESGDNQDKSFSVIAMGRLAAELDPNSKLRDKILRFIRKEALEPKKNNYTRSCAAIAVGIAGDRSAIPTVAALLQDTTAQDHVVSAACVALGLLKATEQADAIRDYVMLNKRWDADTRGYAALGIALMGDTTRIDELKRFAADKSLNDKTKRQLPLALGILGDKSDVKPLIRFFAKNWKKNERYEVSNAAFGLSWIKDQSAVPELVTLADKNPDADVRGMAVIALGYVGAQDRVSPLSRCYENSSHRNRFALWDLLYEIAQIL